MGQQTVMWGLGLSVAVWAQKSVSAAHSVWQIPESVHGNEGVAQGMQGTEGVQGTSRLFTGSGGLFTGSGI